MSLYKEDNSDIKCSTKWNPSDGEINLYISDNEELEANAIANNIEEKFAMVLNLMIFVFYVNNEYKIIALRSLKH